jgi:hypothetical protein
MRGQRERAAGCALAVYGRVYHAADCRTMQQQALLQEYQWVKDRVGRDSTAATVIPGRKSDVGHWQ